MNQSEFTDKPASAWELQDLEERALAEEGPYLEFKKPSEFIKNGQFSWDTFSEEVSETVSAFLNADGGVLFIGVQTSKAPGDGRTESLRPLKDWTPDQTFEHLNITLTTTQIRDRVYSNIMPRPFGVEVKALDVQVGDIQAKVFVVTVPASSTGTHQSTRTHRYYKRTSDGDVPMLDYEIRDVNNRRAGPLLYLACAVSRDGPTIAEDEWKTSLTDLKQVEVHGGTHFSRVTVVFAVTNLGRGTANYIRFDIGMPQPWQMHSYSPKGTDIGAHWVSRSTLQYLLGNRAIVFWRPKKCHEAQYLRSRRRGIAEQYVTWQTAIYNGNDAPAHPVWPTSGRVLVGELELQCQQAGDDCWWLPWRIFTEGMPEIRGTVLLRVSGLSLVVNNYEVDDVSWWGEAEDIQRFNTLKDRFGIT